MSDLTVTCLVCGRRGSLQKDGDNVFSASLIKLDKKVGCICMDCFKTLYTINKDYIDPDNQKSQLPKRMPQIPDSSNKKIKESLSLISLWRCLDNSLSSYIKLIKKDVYGQDEAVKMTAFAIYCNTYHNMLQELGLETPERKAVLLIGPTGVGKTFVAETTAKVMGLPYCKITADVFTAAGYVGGKVEQLLEKLLEKTHGDLDKAEQGVIIIDEICKKVKRSSASGDRDINGLSVQQELLKILEPNDVLIKNGAVTFNTSRLTIVLCGAFVGLDKIIKKRLFPSSIGFSSNAEVPEDLMDYVEPQDLIEYGFIDEFVGRIPDPIVLKPLSFDTIMDILYNKIMKENVLFATKNVSLTIDPLVLNKIVYRVMEHQTGARDIKKQLDRLLFNAEFEVLDHPSEGICEIDEYGKTTLCYKSIDAKTVCTKEIEGEKYLQEDE